MSAAELTELRKAIQKHISQADERVLKMLYAMLEVDVENEKTPFYLTPEQDAILEKHIELYEKGLMKFSSWEEARLRISSKIKNAV